MAAVVRGGARSPVRPKAKASAAPARARAPAAPPPRAYHPAKLHAASRAGLPPRTAVIIAAAVVLVGLGVALFTGGRTHVIGRMAGMGVARPLAGLGFKLQAVRVEGLTPMAQADVMRAIALYHDEPILGVDLDDLRRRVEMVGWVKQAKVVRLLPDTLVIAAEPRPILAVWQYQGVAHVIDAEGKIIAEADPDRFTDLPLVVGEGAADDAATILPLLRGRPKLMSLTEALVRVDGRRWDIRLKDGGIIQLPAVGEDSALIQFDQLEQKAQVLELGFERVDLRDPDAVAVRPRQPVSVASSGVSPGV